DERWEEPDPSGGRCGERGPADERRDEPGPPAVPLEEPDTGVRPARGEGATDEPLLRDGAPDATVGGMATVVTHHVPVPGGNGDRLRHVALGGGAARQDERLLLELAVEDDVTVADRDLVARTGHHALDVVLVG